jgi:AAA15 family ATPase/GTPase
MRISQISFKNFKRFTDLEIAEISHSAKLVLLVGPNGCGKSSVLDGLHHWNRAQSGQGYGGDDAYFKKDPKNPRSWKELVSVVCHGDEIAGPGS